MAERPDFQRLQLAFAAHIRDPDRHPAPASVEDRRMAIYRELFFNNLYKLLSGTFPVLRKVYGPERFRRLVRGFMIRHRAHTPYFLEIPREFLNFLEKEHVAAADDAPFLTELAHYEWVELALSVATDRNDPARIAPDGDLLGGAPALSALARPLSYRFPVHRIAPGFLPDAPGDQPTHLVVYRRANDDMSFMELNAVTARLLGMIADNPAGRPGRELLERLAAEIGYGDTAALLRHGAQAMQDMREAEILVGTRRAA